MKQNIITATLVAATLAVAATSCGIYKKYQTPENTPLTAEYVQARQNSVDSTAWATSYGKKYSPIPY